MRFSIIRRVHLAIFLVVLLAFAGLSVDLLAREISVPLEAVKPSKTELLEPWQLSKEEVSVPIDWVREDWLEDNYSNRLEIKVREGYSDTLNASVYVDGDYVGTTGSDGTRVITTLEPDRYYEVEVRKSGYKNDSDWVLLGATETEQLTFDLEKKVQKASLEVSVQDSEGDSISAEVYLDGDYKDETSRYSGNAEIGSLKPGGYTLKVKKQGFETATEYVHLGEGEVGQVSITLSPANEPPNAGFSYSPHDPEAGQTINFKSDSSDSDGYIDQYKWSFGDDAGDSNEEPNHKYSEPGVYEVELEITDDDGVTDVATKDITVKEKTATLALALQNPRGEALTAKIYLEGSLQGWSWGGNYTISELSAGHYDLTIKKQNYITETESVYLTSGEKEDITITLEKQNQPPNASFTYSPANPRTSQTIKFTSDASDTDGSIEEYTWVFGDNSKSSAKSPIHKFSDPGTYTVELTVTDDDESTDSTTKKISVKNRKPNASFEYSPDQPVVGQSVTYDATSSTDIEGKIREYKWDLNGDGSIDKTGDRVTKTFNSKGTYTVKLEVVDGHGDSDTTTHKMKVIKPEEEGQGEIENRYAFVIGISDYKYTSKSPNLTNLEFAASDAKSFYNLLLDEQIADFSKENVTLLTGKQATTDKIDDALTDLVTTSGPDDLVVIYYSGHGAQGPDYNNDEPDGRDEYYVTYDTDPSTGKSLFKTGYRDDDFADRVRSLRSNQVVIFLDSCYSGGATKAAKGFVPSGQKPVTDNTVFSDFRDLQGDVVFAASQENQFSYEPNTAELKQKLGHGIFTYYLLEGLKGEADKNGDGSITIDELRNYITPQVQEFTENHFASPQVPTVKGNLSVPILQKKEILTGKVKYVQGKGKEKADKGEYVVVNLGVKDGVKRGDNFRVFYTAKGIGVFEKLRGQVKITDVVGPHLAVGKVVKSEFAVEVGYKVKKLDE